MTSSPTPHDAGRSGDVPPTAAVMSEGAEGVVRLGVLGCADIAWRRTLPAVVDQPSLRLVAIASRSQVAAAKFASRFGCAEVTGYQRLLERDDIDAVYIPLPPGLHAEWISRALQAGKHVLAEKPMSTSRSETAELMTLAASSGRVLLENLMFLHHPQHEMVRRLLADGLIGELRTFASTFSIPRRGPDDFRHHLELGGGARLDIAGYPVRAADLFLGPELRVVGAVLRHDRVTGVDVGGSALLTDLSGIAAQVTFGMDHAYISSYELGGSDGRMILNRAFTPSPEHRPTLRIERGGQTREMALPAADQFAAMLKLFAKAALGELGADVLAELDTASLRHAGLLDEILRREIAAASTIAKLGQISWDTATDKATER